MMHAVPFTLNLHFHASYCVMAIITPNKHMPNKHMPGIPFNSGNLIVRATAKIAGLVFYTSGIESHKA